MICSLINNAKLYSLSEKAVKAYLTVLRGYGLDSHDSEFLQKATKHYKELLVMEETGELIDCLEHFSDLKERITRIASTTAPDGYRHILKSFIIEKMIDLLVRRVGSNYSKRKFLPLYSDFEKYVLGRAKYRYYSPLLYLKIDRNVELDQVFRIRKLTPKQVASRRSATTELLSSHHSSLVQCVIEASTNDYLLNEMERKMQELIDPLNLFVPYYVRLGDVTVEMPLFYPVGSSATIGVVPARGSKIWISRLSKKHSEQLRAFIQKFRQIHEKRLSFALRRFNLAKASSLVEDKAVDYVVSLESLFSNSQLEITDKLSLRVGLFHGMTPKDMKKKALFMKKVYVLRSQIVHGRANEVKKAITAVEKIDKNWLSTLDEITKQSIITCTNLISSRAVTSLDGVIDLIDESIFRPAKRSRIRKIYGG